MALTNFGGSAAFPHPNRIMTLDTFVSVCVLKKPVQWGNGKVQLILLSSFEKGFCTQ
jgi:lichenan operon transcriptional antiterminator